MKHTVVKVGTGVLTRDSDGQLDGSSLVRLVTAMADLVASGQPCILVSSGAVGAGISELGLESYPNDVPSRQACAAVGQSRLMHTYQNLFGNFGLRVAQVLLTADDFRDDARRARLSDTLTRLSQFPNVIPIINENDSVAVEELSVGDNDMLSARVANLVGAKLLVLLSNIDGLMPPDSEEIIEYVNDVEDVLDYARAGKGRFSIGGMASKLKAVKYAVDSGIETVIANGRKPARLLEVSKGQGYCTRFAAHKPKA